MYKKNNREQFLTQKISKIKSTKIPDFKIIIATSYAIL